MFEFIVSFFDLALYQPLFNALILIYNYLPGHDFGLAIIVLTLIIRVILYPVAAKALHSQMAMQKLQGRIAEINAKHKNDKEAQAKETLELYRTEKINPFSGLFLALIQLPILIALYRVFWNGLRPEALGMLYSFVVNPGHINTLFIGFFDLSTPNLIFAVGAGLFQFFQTKMLMQKSSPQQQKNSDMSAMMQKQMVYFFPFITVIILLRLPAALGLYWIISGAFSVVQQYYILKKIAKQTPSA